MTAATHDRAFSTADSGSSAADAVLRRAEWQSVLFAESPKRLSLLALRPAWPCRTVRLHVHRNQAFEHVASVMPPFAAYAGWQPEFTYSAYDDALSFAAPGPADLHLVWLDFERYRDRLDEASLPDWLGERLRTLRAQTSAPILVANWPASDAVAPAFNARLQEIADALPGVHVCDLMPIARELGDGFFDARAAALSGSRLSDAANLRVARRMAFHWVQAALYPALKAIAVDLDHTLHAGVLAEEGPEALEITDSHRALHDRLKQARERGVYLALVSRNVTEDVQNLFARRADMGLRWEDFSVHAIGWGLKSESLRRVAERLRIGAEAMLLVDDNPGELAEAGLGLPGVRTLLASADPDQTRRALEWYPGLWKWQASAEDARRIDDLAASETRAQWLASAPSRQDYWRSLALHLEVRVNQPADRARLHELSQKTNQFNLALRRLGEADLADRMNDPRSRVVAVRLSDRLSDSGLVALLAGTLRGQRFVVEELCISCRALGRQIETPMIQQALLAVRAGLGFRELGFAYRSGERNGPGLHWLEQFTGQSLSDAGGEVVVDAGAVTRADRDGGPEMRVDVIGPTH